MNGTLKCDYSNESCCALLSCGAVYYVQQSGSITFRIWNSQECELKWKQAFVQYFPVIMLKWAWGSNFWACERTYSHSNESLFHERRFVFPGVVLGSIFAGYVPLASPDPYPIIVYSVANYRPHVSDFWANIPQIPTCRNLLTPEIPQMRDPILVTLLAPNENATHYSQSSRENATPSSGTSPLAYY